MSGMGTNNPFRRRASVPPGAPAPPTHPQIDISEPTLFDSYITPPPVDGIGPPASSDNALADGNPEKMNQKERPEPPKSRNLKKVQIQTPPPLSPSSPEDSSSSEDDDPFLGADSTDDKKSAAGGFPGTQSNTGANSWTTSTPGPPQNPFAKTLHDMEHGAKSGDGSEGPRHAAPRASMDVDAFKRLLLTGYAGLDGQSQDPNSPTSRAAGTQASTNSVETCKPTSQPTTKLQPPESASTTDASRQSSLFDTIPESPTAATPHEPEEEGPLAASPAPHRKKQPPPAPASRHGKLIKIELGKDKVARGKEIGETETDAADKTPPKLHRSPSDINKPLPPQPIAITYDDSPFDREAAGKLPERVEREPHVAMLHTPSPDPDEANSAKPQQAAKKAPAPVPPPRRHARGDSKVFTGFSPNTTQGTPSPSSGAEDSQPSIYPVARRTSVESARSSTRAHAPAPPPPRRPHHQSRSSVTTIPLASPGHLGSPSTVSLPSPHVNITPDTASIYSVASEAPPVPPHSKHSALSPTHAKTFPTALSPSAVVSPGGGNEARDPLSAKMSPPPRPPTRNPSTRRPLSISSFDMNATPRKISREGVPPPPPPPPKRVARSRGDSRGSDTTLVGRRESFDVRDTVLEESSPVVTIDGETVKVDGDVAVVENKSHANEILADLDALQREVDTLRGRYEQVGNSVGGAQGGG
ncbi:hypothetical protein MKZ38_001894 [Zalerion maritima]|uniref:Uncharacterized protein n=1 Tax=Zalerion maritima TaxID=339359 RepID=A0AAD5WR73_9PEZI|nr:hypothetical protein MKZ38_001894 [Zalerion maritima]